MSNWKFLDFKIFGKAILGSYSVSENRNGRRVFTTEVVNALVNIHNFNVGNLLVIMVTLLRDKQFRIN